MSLRKFSIISLIGCFYLKFFFQIVLKIDNVFLDIVLYPFLLMSIDYRRVHAHFFVIFLLLIVSILNSAARNIFLIFLCVYILRDITLKKIAFMNSFFTMVLLFITFFMIQFQIVNVEMFPQTLLDSRVRWDFGFGNPNTFALFVYSGIMNVYLCCVGKNKYLFFFFAVLVSWMIYSYTGSRSFFFAMLIFLLVYVLINSKNRLNRFFFGKYLLWILPLLLTGLIVFFIPLAKDFLYLDVLFSGRLSLYANFLAALSVKDYCIGTSAINEGTIDNSYLHLLFEGGIIGYVLFYCLYYKTIKCLDEPSFYILPVLLSFLIYGLTESVFTFVLIWGNMIVWILLYQFYLKRSC